MSEEGLSDLMALAIAKPSSVTPGAALAIALHTLMVREGFSVEEGQGGGALPAKSVRHSSYQPPSYWQIAAGIPNEWQFIYTHPSKSSRFKLIVSLHKDFGRAFIHASEDTNPNNIQVLGLQLENYIHFDTPSPLSSNGSKEGGVMILGGGGGGLNVEKPSGQNVLLKAHEWGSVVKNEEGLTSYFLKHILAPLLKSAEDVPPLVPTPKGGAKPSSGTRRALSPQSDSYHKQPSPSPPPTSSSFPTLDAVLPSNRIFKESQGALVMAGGALVVGLAVGYVMSKRK